MGLIMINRPKAAIGHDPYIVLKNLIKIDFMIEKQSPL